MILVFFFVIVFVFHNFYTYTQLKLAFASAVDHGLPLSHRLHPPCWGSLEVEFITLPGGPAALDGESPINLPLVGPGSLLTSSGQRVHGTQLEPFHTFLAGRCRTPAGIFRKVLCNCPWTTQHMLPNTRVILTCVPSWTTWTFHDGHWEAFVRVICKWVIKNKKIIINSNIGLLNTSDLLKD